MRNSTESRTYQAYHPGLVETSNGFRSELPTNSIRDTNHWELHSRISNPGFYPADLNGGVQSNVNLRLSEELNRGSFDAHTPMIKKHVHFEDSNINSLPKPKSSNFFVDLFKSFKNGESSVEGGGWVNGGDLRRHYKCEQTVFTKK